MFWIIASSVLAYLAVGAITFGIVSEIEGKSSTEDMWFLFIGLWPVVLLMVVGQLPFALGKKIGLYWKKKEVLLRINQAEEEFKKLKNV